MSDSAISHISVGTNDYDRSKAFYDQILPTLGMQIIVEHPGAVAYGRKYPEFWLQVPINGEPAAVGNGFHVGLIADSPEQVQTFYAAALAAGAIDEGAPGPRPHYGEAYYGCFVRDPEGYKIEATYWDMALIQRLYFSEGG
jgi:catechol 2,3-dioxygenase-like lactoylglutathione lyase family enzyme